MKALTIYTSLAGLECGTLFILAGFFKNDLLTYILGFYYIAFTIIFWIILHPKLWMGAFNAKILIFSLVLVLFLEAAFFVVVNGSPVAYQVPQSSQTASS